MFAGSTQVQRKFELEIRELELHERVEMNGLAVTPYLMKHYSGAPSYALRIETEGKVLTYSGDTEWVEELIPAARDADLFICEAYFFDKVMKYHIDYTTLVNHLPQIGAKRTIVTHMSAELLGRGSEIEARSRARRTGRRLLALRHPLLDTGVGRGVEHVGLAQDHAVLREDLFRCRVAADAGKDRTAARHAGIGARQEE